MKPQIVRLADVFLIGPVMIYSACQLPQKNEKAKLLLGLFGFGTIVYNWQNYQKVKAIKRLE